MDDLTQVIVPLLTALGGYLAKRYLGERKWKQVRTVAREIAKDPNRTNDPRQAVAEAMLTVAFKRLQHEAVRVQDAFVVNGSNPYPKLEIPWPIEKDRDSE